MIVGLVIGFVAGAGFILVVGLLAAASEDRRRPVEPAEGASLINRAQFRVIEGGRR